MVQRVMLGDVKVAEVCEEYIKELGERRVIVYPCDAQGRAILTKGVSATDSGTAAWDLEASKLCASTRVPLTLLYTPLADMPITLATASAACASNTFARL